MSYNASSEKIPIPLSEKVSPYIQAAGNKEKLQQKNPDNNKLVSSNINLFLAFKRDLAKLLSDSNFEYKKVLLNEFCSLLKNLKILTSNSLPNSSIIQVITENIDNSLSELSDKLPDYNNLYKSISDIASTFNSDEYLNYSNDLKLIFEKLNYFDSPEFIASISKETEKNSLSYKNVISSINKINTTTKKINTNIVDIKKTLKTTQKAVLSQEKKLSKITINGHNKLKTLIKNIKSNQKSLSSVQFTKKITLLRKSISSKIMLSAKSIKLNIAKIKTNITSLKKYFSKILKTQINILKNKVNIILQLLRKLKLHNPSNTKNKSNNQQPKKTFLNRFNFLNNIPVFKKLISLLKKAKIIKPSKKTKLYENSSSATLENIYEAVLKTQQLLLKFITDSISSKTSIVKTVINSVLKIFKGFFKVLKNSFNFVKNMLSSIYKSVLAPLGKKLLKFFFSVPGAIVLGIFAGIIKSYWGSIKKWYDENLADKIKAISEFTGNFTAFVIDGIKKIPDLITKISGFFEKIEEFSEFLRGTRDYFYNIQYNLSKIPGLSSLRDSIPSDFIKRQEILQNIIDRNKADTDKNLETELRRLYHLIETTPEAIEQQLARYKLGDFNSYDKNNEIDFKLLRFYSQSASSEQNKELKKFFKFFSKKFNVDFNSVDSAVGSYTKNVFNALNNKNIIPGGGNRNDYNYLTRSLYRTPKEIFSFNAFQSPASAFSSLLSLTPRVVSSLASSSPDSVGERYTENLYNNLNNPLYQYLAEYDLRTISVRNSIKVASNKLNNLNNELFKIDRQMTQLVKKSNRTKEEDKHLDELDKKYTNIHNDITDLKKIINDNSATLVVLLKTFEERGTTNPNPNPYIGNPVNMGQRFKNNWQVLQ